MKTFLIIIAASLLSLSFKSISVAEEIENEMPYIAKWYGNKKAAISLRFDDSLDSHVNTVIPILNKLNIKATFMINPGRKSYKRHKIFWEQQLPQMIHRMGNHTWHHKGAKDMTEAEREIGSVSKLIWQLYPNHSKLMVFASGGGEKWEGRFWENADNKYKQLASKYHLIDLFDGHHKAKGVEYDDSAEDLCNSVRKTILIKSHKSFAFHGVGNLTVKDYLKKILRKTIYTYDATKFGTFANCLKELDADIWIGHLVQIYKYESERKNSKLSIISRQDNLITLFFEIGTDPLLYNHPLTLVLPGDKPISKLYQTVHGQKHIVHVHDLKHSRIADLKPFTSEIEIIYE